MLYFVTVSFDLFAAKIHFMTDLLGYYQAQMADDNQTMFKQAVFTEAAFHFNSKKQQW